MSPWPGGHHSCEGSFSHSTGVRSSTRSLGSLCWTKSAGTGDSSSGCSASLASESSRVWKEFISTSGTGAPARSRSASTWRATTSRKVSPSLASISDLACVMPMLVPRPPLSLSTTARSSGPSSSGSSSKSVTSSTGSIESSGSIPVSPLSSCS